MDPTLQLIMDQFKELKADISDMIEDKVGNSMSTIAEGLKTDLNGLRNEVRALDSRMNEGKAEMEGRLEGQQKEVTAIVEQQIQHLREDIEATRRELESRLAAVDASAVCTGSGGPRASSSTVKPPRFDGTTSWAVFHRQFEAAAVQNNWTQSERAAHLLSVLHGKAADILHTVPADAPYEAIVGALRDRFGDHQLAAAYRSQLKTRMQANEETLQEFAAAVEQLAHRAFVGLPVNFIQTEAAHSFIDGLRDREVKQHLLLGGDRTLNEALNQALKLEAAKATAGPPARLRELTGAPARASQPPDHRREGRPICWQCGSPGHLRRDCRRGRRDDRDSGNE